MIRGEIGSRIKALREARGYTREELAERAEISSKFLYEVEKGRKGLSADTLLKISRTLSCSCDYILSGVKSGDGKYGSEALNKHLFKDFNEKQCEIISEILQLLLELNEEKLKHEL